MGKRVITLICIFVFSLSGLYAQDIASCFSSLSSNEDMHRLSFGTFSLALLRMVGGSEMEGYTAR